MLDAKTMVEDCQKRGCRLSDLMREREKLLTSPNEVQERMAESWQIMKKAAHKAIVEPQRSMGGLIGGEARLLQEARLSKGSFAGDLLAKASTYAMAVMEVNASMGLIVAAPTAGSAGVLPGVMLAMQEEFGFSDEAIIDALFCAGAVGFLINQSATLAGAEGGCQAEVGSAAAMAAAAGAELLGLSPQASMEAASLCLMNLLGLVCDPVRGLVEVPCQLRNAQGTATALLAIELVRAGISAPVPLDQMIPIMYRVGQSLGMELRETALGGTATAPCFHCGGCQRGEGR